MVSPREAAHRAAGRLTHRLTTLPVLALNVHTACNCRCVMCDIWKANAANRQISHEELSRHLGEIRRLRVQRVMLTGGEPLLHRNLWALCEALRREGIRLTLVTTGLLIERHVDQIAATVDELVISIDGPREVHDEIRRVPGAFERIEIGLALLRERAVRPRVIARCVVQRANHGRLADTIEAVATAGADRLSFLAADVTSGAFNRARPWPAERQAEVAVSADELGSLRAAVHDVERRCAARVAAGFLEGGLPSLWRIYDYYAALNGLGEFPAHTCNAPWVSAVLEPGGALRPCFFHGPYAASEDRPLRERLNSPEALAFRRALDVRTDPTCARCVCTLSVPVWRVV